jgi:FkbM family methyltransferase
LGIISVRRFEPVVFKYITSQKGKIMIDIGANIGAYSILSYNNFEEILAVEPGQEALHILQQNIILNNANNITVISKAVSDKIGSVKLYRTPELVNYSIKNESGSYIEVQTISLSQLLHPFNSVDLVKIDVEGSELEVIYSGLELITRVKSLIIEVRQKYVDKIILLMEKNGFQCYCLEFRKDLQESNLLFVNTKNNAQ